MQTCPQESFPGTLRQERVPRRSQRAETLTAPEQTKRYPSAPRAGPGARTAPASHAAAEAAPGGAVLAEARRAPASHSGRGSAAPAGSGRPWRARGTRSRGPRGRCSSWWSGSARRSGSCRVRGAMPGAGRAGRRLGSGGGDARGRLGSASPLRLPSQEAPLGSASSSEGRRRLWRRREQPWQCPRRGTRTAVARWCLRAAVWLPGCAAGSCAGPAGGLRSSPCRGLGSRAMRGICDLMLGRWRDVRVLLLWF